MPTFDLSFANDLAKHSSMKTNLRIQNFSDYRVFLQAHAQDMKKHKTTWSYGLWAKSLGLKTTSSLTKIIQGQREPGPQMTDKIVRYFCFDHKQAQYFKDLIRLQKIKNDPRLSVLLMEKIGKEHPKASLRLMDDKSFLVISNWYYLALRELTRMQGFQEDPEWISKKFLFKVTGREVTHALNVLIEMGLLARDKNNELKIVDGRLDTSNDIASEAIRRYHEQMLEHARAAIRRVSVENREITSTTLMMSSKQMGVAKELIREFKQKFEQLMEDEAGDQVFQIQIQLFPLTLKES